MKAIETAGYRPGEDVVLALDCAATEFFKDGAYVYEGEGKTRSTEEQVDYLAELVGDTRSSRSRTAWPRTTGRAGSAHRPDRHQVPAGRRRSLRHQHRAARRASSTGSANSILVKVNQIGTLTETLEAVEMAHKAGYTAVMSHRSGETEDSTIADLAVATNCGQIKTGSLALRPDRKVQPVAAHRGGARPQARYAGRSILKALA